MLISWTPIDQKENSREWLAEQLIFIRMVPEISWLNSNWSVRWFLRLVGWIENGQKDGSLDWLAGWQITRRLAQEIG